MRFSLKFLPVKDLFYSVFPTVGTYGGYLKGVAPSIFPNVWTAVAIGLAASIVLALIFRQENIKAYKRSLAEILATGYFMNFTGRLGRLLQAKYPIDFIFPGNQVHSLSAEQIRVEVGIPESFDALVRYRELVDRLSEIVYVREPTRQEPFWLKAKMEHGQLVIYEFPRTLFSIPQYLKAEFSDRRAADKNSRKIFSFFQAKIEQLAVAHSTDFPHGRLLFKTV
jgi:hypothetical protein